MSLLTHVIVNERSPVEECIDAVPLLTAPPSVSEEIHECIQMRQEEDCLAGVSGRFTTLAEEAFS